MIESLKYKSVYLYTVKRTLHSDAVALRTRTRIKAVNVWSVEIFASGYTCLRGHLQINYFYYNWQESTKIVICKKYLMIFTICFLILLNKKKNSFYRCRSTYQECYTTITKPFKHWCLKMLLQKLSVFQHRKSTNLRIKPI